MTLNVYNEFFFLAIFLSVSLSLLQLYSFILLFSLLSLIYAPYSFLSEVAHIYATLFTPQDVEVLCKLQHISAP